MGACTDLPCRSGLRLCRVGCLGARGRMGNLDLDEERVSSVKEQDRYLPIANISRIMVISLATKRAQH